MPLHTAAVPVIVDGCAGIAVALTDKVAAVDVPHELPAVTLIVPPVDAGVALMLVVVLLPVQPEGRLQVYVVAPETVAIE